ITAHNIAVDDCPRAAISARSSRRSPRNGSRIDRGTKTSTDGSHHSGDSLAAGTRVPTVSRRLDESTISTWKTSESIVDACGAGVTNSALQSPTLLDSLRLVGGVMTAVMILLGRTPPKPISVFVTYKCAARR